jgi:hypothetical protein
VRYDPAYPATIEAVCALEAVDLIIPATDELRARGIPLVISVSVIRQGAAVEIDAADVAAI